MRKLLGSVAKKSTKVNPVAALTTAVTGLAEVAKDYGRIIEEEKTKRTMITAQKDVAIERIHAQKEVLLTHINNSYAERAITLNKYFDVIDAALEDGDTDKLQIALAGITKVIEISPIAEVKQLEAALKNNDDIVV